MQKALAMACLFLSASAVSAADGVTWLAPDFFISGAGVHVEQVPIAPADCPAAIASKVCVAAPGSRMGETGRPCLPGGEKYGPPLAALYSAMPPALGQLFCGVSVIYVEQQLDSIAYAGENSASPVVGIRQSVLDQGMALSTLMTWKEQLPFGGSKEYGTPRPDLPTVSGTIPGVKDDALYYVLTHEMGHLLDFSRNLNQSGGWHGISWRFLGLSRWELVFPLRRKIDFYGDGPRMPPSDIERCYSQLEMTDYVSLYAATNPYEDLAESVAHDVLLEKGGSYDVKLPSGKLVDAKTRFESQKFDEKRSFVKKVLAQPQPLAKVNPLPPIREFPAPESIPWDGAWP